MKSYDPRSKLIRHDKNGQPLMDKVTRKITASPVLPEMLTIPNVVLVAVVYESSSWGGQKFDTYAYLPSPHALDMFKRHLEKFKTREEYNFITDVRLCQVAPECVQAMADKTNDKPDQPWLRTNTDYAVKLWD